MPKQAIERVVIVGAGWVGRQIAAKMAQHGIQVRLVDRDESVCKSALNWMSEIEGHRDWISQITTSVALDETTAEFGTPQLALECTPEQISLKKRVLRQISACFESPCIIASNSSYFVPSVLSKFVQSPSRFAHMHFHVPVLRNTVADIVGCEDTEPWILEHLAKLAERIGQSPLILRQEHPGDVFNWLLQSVLRSALELVALDVVDPADVDRSWKAVTGRPQGPFGIKDQMGLDVVEQVLANARWAEPIAVPDEKLLAILKEKTEAGQLGVKTGSGFYNYLNH